MKSELKNFFKRRIEKKILSYLYKRFEKSNNLYFSSSQLARELGEDRSKVNKILKKFKKEKIVFTRDPNNKEKNAEKGGRIRKLYRISITAYKTIKKNKTAP